MTISKKRLAELVARTDDRIDHDEIPVLDETFWKNARKIEPDPTRAVTLRIRQSVLDSFKAQGKGYQTRMNAVLESYVRSLSQDQG